MRRVFVDNFEWTRIYQTSHLKDSHQQAEQTKLKTFAESKGEEMDFSQLLRHEMEMLSVV